MRTRVACLDLIRFDMAWLDLGRALRRHGERYDSYCYTAIRSRRVMRRIHDDFIVNLCRVV